MSDVKIHTYPDEEVGTIAVVMVWHTPSSKWVNSCLVVNDPDPVIAFKKALAMAKEKGLWE